MFKNNKEKDNYISTEEVEKMYKFQEKTFDAKIVEQKKKIEELTNYISARFGEDVANSNIGTKLKNIERTLQDIETKNKTNLEKSSKALKKEIEKESQRIAAELNDAQTEAYFKLLQKNESDLEKLKAALSEKENNEKLLSLDKTLQEHIKDEETYRNEIEKEFKNTNQKIGKINYLGITGKFDKKIKEECSKLDEQIENVKNQTEENIAKLDEQFSGKIEQVQANLQVNGEEIVKLQTMFVNENEKMLSNVENNENRVIVLDERLTEEIENVDKDLKKVENSVKDLGSKLTKEIEVANENIQKVKSSVSDLDQKLLKEIEAANENIQITKKDLNAKILKEIGNVNKNVQAAINSASGLDEKFSEEILKVNNSVQSNEITIFGLEGNLTKQIEQTKEAINKLRDISKNKNVKLEEKIKLTEEKITAVQDEIKTTKENVTKKIEEIKRENSSDYMQLKADTEVKIDTKLQEAITSIGDSKNEISKINNTLKQVKKDTLAETEKIKNELNEQIINNNNENKAELENISASVEDIRNDMEGTISNIGQEIEKLKQEVKNELENQDNEDIELLKKDYNKYVTKVNNELAKISKDLLNAQKKNLEQNRNLQVKIKAYIDAKIEKISNSQNIEELINSLNLSILEREKLQRLEMEELLNKKLKTIQKENEKLLNKKIEEIASRLIRTNSTNIANTRPNNVTIYEEVPTKKKKNVYELIDEDQILKRSASNKKTLSTGQEGKSQILKFFYDEEE